MATIVPLKGENIAITLGNGATPTEVFAAPAILNGQRSYTFTVNTESDELVDPADLSAPAVTSRTAKSIDYKIDGEGMVAKADLATWLAWMSTGAVKNVKTTDGTNTITCPMICTQFQVTGEIKKCSTAQITLEAAGKPVVTTF